MHEGRLARTIGSKGERPGREVPGNGETGIVYEIYMTSCEGNEVNQVSEQT